MKAIASIVIFLYHLQIMKHELWTTLVTYLAYCIDKGLQKGRMRCKMSNFTVLKTPYWNISNRELKTRVESSQIRQTLYDFSRPFGNLENPRVHQNVILNDKVCITTLHISTQLTLQDVRNLELKKYTLYLRGNYGGMGALPGGVVQILGVILASLSKSVKVQLS